MSLADKQAITEVLYRYARAVDRKDFAAVAACYFDDANDNHGAYNGGISGLIEDMEARHRTIDSSMHYVTNVLIELDDDAGARSEAYCLCCFRFRPEEASGPAVLATIRCRYVDRFEKRAGEWRIADRIVVFDEYRTERVVDELDPSWVHARRTADDPVYTGRP
ncbi:nuclear transport factor 2 family protein [Pseudonocardia sp. MH-G8]|uniref:nuclear transport factor 2 family protein n=1 Tax=Pseudonocardia sp. MH-G8 TaxID=1854588 RepID=UPI000BA0A3C4|nr:nuclear transport factor 2 family protein [Pseudonocardia sp. MH-G8]OZM76852.1 gamma-BHC dehydrochlorinase [Pseudonocardia sp. MH-G8]